MLKKLVTALAVVGASVSAANAASGNVDLHVELPQVLVLYHWDQVGIEFEAKDIAKATGKGAEKVAIDVADINVLDSNSSTATFTDQTPAISDSVLSPENLGRTNGSIIPVVLKKSWAVRSLTTSGQVGLKVENTTSEHVHTTDKASKITTKDTRVKTDAVPAGEEITLESNWTPTYGDIAFNLDLASAKKSGTYSSTGETFTLTLTAK